MAVISKDEADVLLGPHKFGLRQAVLDAWADYRNNKNYSDGVRAIHDSTTRANCVHAHIKTRVSEYAARHHDLEPVISVRMFALIVKHDSGDVIGIRFKKVDNELRTANVSTDQVRAFKRQEEIPEIGAKHHLEFGYRLDETEQNILGIFLLCPSGEHSNAWVDEVHEATTVPVVSDFFVKLEHAAPEEETNNVRPRRRADVVPLKRDAKHDPESR